MAGQQIITLTILFCLSVARGFVGVNPTEPFNFSTEVDTNGNYLLFWKFNDTHITFEVHVKTYGYVAFGLSDNGKMYPADVVVGWVKDGITHFKDYHTTAHAPPVVDSHQDWFLLHGEENNFGTVLKFVRKLDTCDKTEDKKIEDGTIRVIYSYHTSDPSTDVSLMYHGPDHRGTKSLSLLSVSSAASVTSSSQHQNVRLYDFLNENYIIPSATTTYSCHGFRMPNIGGKHHMIKVEPIITPGNEKHVHHILVYRCRGIDPKFDKVRYVCYDEIPAGMNPCNDVIIAWAIGGKTFYYPEHVGFSVGASDDPDFYIMQIHYDNPVTKSGMIDNSGIRITLTNNLRPYEADMMEIGHGVDWRHIIPPFEKAYISQSHCASQCIDHTLGNLTEVKAFAVFQHAHLLGRAIKTRHFRNGSELPPLATDPHYDFDFQETRLLREEIAIRRGDSFIVECTYDSSGRSAATLGGLSTRDEMCLSFLLYYPKVALKQCVSSPTYDSLSNDQNRVWPMLSAYNWTTQHNRDQFKQKLKESSIFHFCQGDTMVPKILTYDFHEKPPVHVYVPPKSSTCPQE
ncbi:hypothetical protein ACJMK2_039734 [Sinanodonta woodiana]|uniref:DOMON domain-containing protein n=1 Tax=Sinanodonta woodiana TaxID=1069815 RepID=A0ABD3WDU8_SINWO